MISSRIFRWSRFAHIACGATLCTLVSVFPVGADVRQLLNPSDDLLMGRTVIRERISRATRPAGLFIAPVATARNFRLSREGLFLRKPVSSDSAVNVEIRIPEELDELEAVRNEDAEFELDRLGIGVGMELQF
jgi:hypothetical protein